MKKRKLIRCWNCKQFNWCTDYRTFAYGCLNCSEHEPEPSILRIIDNWFIFIHLEPPCKYDDEPDIEDEFAIRLLF